MVFERGEFLVGERHRAGQADARVEAVGGSVDRTGSGTAWHEVAIIEHRLDDDDAAPSAVDVTAAVTWDAIRCGHVDEPAAEPCVSAALTGAEGTLDRLDECDLLWYDASELDAIPR